MWSRLSAVGVANDDLGEQAGDCAAERCAWVPESEHGCGSWKRTQESTPASAARTEGGAMTARRMLVSAKSIRSALTDGNRLRTAPLTHRLMW